MLSLFFTKVVPFFIVFFLFLDKSKNALNDICFYLYSVKSCEVQRLQKAVVGGIGIGCCNCSVTRHMLCVLCGSGYTRA